jgi:biotin carboxyl carrier protein
MKYVSTIGDREFIVEIIDDRHVMIDGKVFVVDFNDVSDQPVFSLIIDGQSYEALVYPVEESWEVLMHGHLYPAKVEDERERRLRAASGGNIFTGTEFHLKAPMPGLVVSIAVEEGQEVNRGDLLVILESMKMQNELKSPRDGVIARLRVKSGDSVEQKQTLLSVV